MEDKHGHMALTGEQKSNVSGAGAKENRAGRSRTLLFPSRLAGPRVRFRGKESEDDRAPQNFPPITSRSPELNWFREIRSERNKSTSNNSQLTSFGPFPHGMGRNTSSPASSSGSSLTALSPVSHPRSSSRRSSPQITEPKLGSKTERHRNGRGRERRSKSLAVHEPRRRSSCVLSSSHFPHGSAKGMKLQECTSSSRDSDGSRGRTSLSVELGRSVSDRPSRLKNRWSSGSKREGSGRSPIRSPIRSPVRSPTRLPQSNRLRHTNVELAMALPAEDTMEQMFKLKSDCYGSETETMSMKGIVSSLIAIENEEI